MVHLIVSHKKIQHGSGLCVSERLHGTHGMRALVPSHDRLYPLFTLALKSSVTG